MNRKFWYYFYIFIVGQTSPREQALSDASQINCGPSSTIQEHLDRARRSRRSALARVFPWRRRYLDGLIACLENECARREPDG